LLETTKHAFNAVGLDLEAIMQQHPNLFNATNISNSINYLKALQKTNLGFLSQKEIKFLLDVLPPSSVKLQRILGKWGDSENASKIIYEHFRSISSVTSGEESLIISTLEIARKFNNLNITKL
jgi:hypothetical protein